MDLNIQGKLVKVLPSQSGEGKNGTWIKQSFVIETDDRFPKKICLIAWNERTETLKTLQEGNNLKIEISIESREYNERWYTDVRAINIEVIGGNNNTQTTSADTSTSISNNDLGTPPDFPTSSIEDLPF